MHLNLAEVDRIIAAALTEDLGRGDLTSALLIPPQASAGAKVVSREPHIVCGLPVIERLFARLSPDMRVSVEAVEGETAKAGHTLLRIEGNARQMLAAERTALNLIQRMSGVATLTRRYVEAIKGTQAVILDTRKTMPGLRALDKYATVIGGARNHRLRLDDGVLIKDNHIVLAGGVAQAVRRARSDIPSLMRLEVECETPAQALEAVEAGADIVLLDNMTLGALREAVAAVKGRALTEASGNVTPETVRAIAETGVDFISVGRITHSAPAADIGLDIERLTP